MHNRYSVIISTKWSHILQCKQFCLSYHPFLWRQMIDAHRHMNRWTNWQTNKVTDSQRQTDRQMDKHTKWQIDGEIGRQMDWTSRQTTSETMRHTMQTCSGWTRTVHQWVGKWQQTWSDIHHVPESLLSPHHTRWSDRNHPWPPHRLCSPPTTCHSLQTINHATTW